MKLRLASVIFLFTSLALANPFDSFVGTYSIVGAPNIQKSGTADECVRFGFAYLTGFSVTADTTGYHQTHDLRFYFAGGSSGQGWSGYPAADFNDQANGVTVNSAQTTGDANKAENDSFTSGGPSADQLDISIAHQGDQYLLTVRESYLQSGTETGACFYQATLNKQ